MSTKLAGVDQTQGHSTPLLPHVSVRGVLFPRNRSIVALVDEFAAPFGRHWGEVRGGARRMNDLFLGVITQNLNPFETSTHKTMRQLFQVISGVSTLATGVAGLPFLALAHLINFIFPNSLLGHSLSAIPVIAIRAVSWIAAAAVILPLAFLLIFLKYLIMTLICLPLLIKKAVTRSTQAQTTNADAPPPYNYPHQIIKSDVPGDKNKSSWASMDRVWDKLWFHS